MKFAHKKEVAWGLGLIMYRDDVDGHRAEYSNKLLLYTRCTRHWSGIFVKKRKPVLTRHSKHDGQNFPRTFPIKKLYSGEKKMVLRLIPGLCKTNSSVAMHSPATLWEHFRKRAGKIKSEVLPPSPRDLLLVRNECRSRDVVAYAAESLERGHGRDCARAHHTSGKRCE
jgi:hypothetical protein